MICFSWLTPGHAADSRQGAACPKASAEESTWHKQPKREPFSSCTLAGSGRVEVWLAGGLVLAKMLGFLQASSPGGGKGGARVTMGLDACLGGCEKAGCEQTPSLPPRRPPHDCAKRTSPETQPSLSRQATMQSSPTARPNTATQPSPARWPLSLMPSWPAARGEARLLWEDL